ncbi:MAG: DUF134 domain-containing protein [Propionivibrio sp.]
MARPLKCRRVACEIPVRYFKPQGIPMYALEEIELALDEVEAMRLTDVEDLYQAEAAERMGVSRQTLGNIIARAHKKVALAIMQGKALRISGVCTPEVVAAATAEAESTE